MKRIAVVEDEVYMREELCNMLQKDGYLAEAITEFEDAARLLAALRPDLVILDLNLPEITRSGRRAARSRAASSNSVIAPARYPSF